MNVRTDDRGTLKLQPIASDAGARAELTRLFKAAVTAAHAESLIVRNSSFAGQLWRYRDDDLALDWHIPADGRLLVVGAGKAAGSLARGVERVMGERIDAGLVIAKYGHREPLRRIRVVEAGHPVPDAAGVGATRLVLELLSGLRANDRVLVLLTGGASSLLVAPQLGVSLAEKASVTQLMLRSGMSIDEINTIRIALSRVKGGRLLAALAPAQALTLAISDVPSGDPGLIGSGPTVARKQAITEARAILARRGLLAQMPPSVRSVLDSRLEPPAVPPGSRLAVIADSGTGLNAAAHQARQADFRVVIVDAHMQGETHLAATAFARQLKTEAAALNPGDRPVVLLAAGETTLQVRGTGLGGRNQEFALVAARELAGSSGTVLLAAGTDGTDGPTDAAGAFASGTTLSRGAAAGLDADAALANNDSHRYFSRLGDTYVSGPTGTNIMDLVIGVAYAAPG